MCIPPVNKKLYKKLTKQSLIAPYFLMILCIIWLIYSTMDYDGCPWWVQSHKFCSLAIRVRVFHRVQLCPKPSLIHFFVKVKDGLKFKPFWNLRCCLKIKSWLKRGACYSKTGHGPLLCLGLQIFTVLNGYKYLLTSQWRVAKTINFFFLDLDSIDRK